MLADAVRLGRIVDNLLVLARIDEGRLELLKRPHDLRELVDRIAAAHQAGAAAGGVTLVVAGEHVHAEVDRDRLEQVLRNLLENAIQYAPAGSTVEIRAWEQSGAAQLSVSDAGPGIARDQRERVFERFSREDKARSRIGWRGTGAGDLPRDRVRPRREHLGRGPHGSRLPRRSRRDAGHDDPRDVAVSREARGAGAAPACRALSAAHQR